MAKTCGVSEWAAGRTAKVGVIRKDVQVQPTVGNVARYSSCTSRPKGTGSRTAVLGTCMSDVMLAK